jgi:hypothetical protein
VLSADRVDASASAAGEDHLRGSPEQLAVALRAYGKIGVEHIALQFMVPRWPERREQIERFAQEVMPAFSTR